jgi:very-short-patch-repair endonuclease
MTDAERRLWYWLRAHRFAGHKFKRQVPLGRYVVDFACLNRSLVIEVDGGQHADSARDRQRDAWLRARGFQVLRFWNNDVLKNTEGVLEMILAALEQSLSRLGPAVLGTLSPSGRGDHRVRGEILIFLTL